MNEGLSPVVDLARERRVRLSLDELETLLADTTTGARWEALVIGELTSPDLEMYMPNDATITLRLPVEDLDRADELVPHLEKVPTLRAARVSRSLVLRLALYEGLEALEKRYKTVVEVEVAPVASPPVEAPSPSPPATAAPAPDDPASAYLREYPKPSRRSKPKTEVGRRLREWRERQGLTQAQAAEKIGVAQNTWSSLETGKRKRTPKATTLEALEALTGIPVAAWTEDK